MHLDPTGNARDEESLIPGREVLQSPVPVQGFEGSEIEDAGSVEYEPGDAGLGGDGVGPREEHVGDDAVGTEEGEGSCEGVSEESGGGEEVGDEGELGEGGDVLAAVGEAGEGGGGKWYDVEVEVSGGGWFEGGGIGGGGEEGGVDAAGGEEVGHGEHGEEVALGHEGEEEHPHIGVGGFGTHHVSESQPRPRCL